MKNIGFLLYFMPFFCTAQSAFTAKIHLGYSNPTSVAKSYIFSAYEVTGRFSQNIYLGYEKKLGIHTIRVQSGLSLLGFQTRQFEGFTSPQYFPEIENGKPVLIKTIYKLNYFDNSLGYGIDVKRKINLAVSLHYLLNIRSYLVAHHSFLDGSISNTSAKNIIVDTDLNRQNFGFYNHFATSLEVGYCLKNVKIGGNYLIGLSEFNPFLKTFRDKTRLNQNFSVFLSHKLWSFKK